MSDSLSLPIEDDWPVRDAAQEELLVDLEGFAGPLDLLLDLARKQTVDLKQISILKLAEQYADFVENAKALRIELAADYLVMAAWLALLKSKLLLPENSEEPSGEELAAQLAFRLQRLDAMRAAAKSIMGRRRLGEDFFPRGAPEEISVVRKPEHSATVLDLMQAYARIRARARFTPYNANRDFVISVDEALESLRYLIGDAVEWADLRRFLPDEWTRDPQRLRSATASLFAASLELAKSGDIELRQNGSFAPIQLKKKDKNDGG